MTSVVGKGWKRLRQTLSINETFDEARKEHTFDVRLRLEYLKPPKIRKLSLSEYDRYASLFGRIERVYLPVLLADFSRQTELSSFYGRESDCRPETLHKDRRPFGRLYEDVLELYGWSIRRGSVRHFRVEARLTEIGFWHLVDHPVPQLLFNLPPLFGPTLEARIYRMNGEKHVCTLRREADNFESILERHPPEQQQVIRLRYGLEDGREHPPEELARTHHLSTKTIRESLCWMHPSQRIRYAFNELEA